MLHELAQCLAAVMRVTSLTQNVSVPLVGLRAMEPRLPGLLSRLLVRTVPAEGELRQMEDAVLWRTSRALMASFIERQEGMRQTPKG